MRLIITEKQLKHIVKRNSLNQQIHEEDAAAAAPEAGTSSDGDTKTGMSKWESGVTRGPANQIAVTRWKDIAGVTPARGKANPLWEQSDYAMDRRANALLYSTGIRSKEDYESVDRIIDQSKIEMFGPINAHDVNMVLGIAALAIPYVGPFISAGIGMYDASLYYKEGDKKTAGMIAMFSLLPGVGAIANKIPGVKQLGTKAMAEIGKKLSLGAKITNPAEVAVVKQITKNRALVELELKKASEAALAAAAKNKAAKEVTIAAAKNTAKKKLVQKAVVNKAKDLGKTAAGLTAASVGYNIAYDKIVGEPTAKDYVGKFTQSTEPPVQYKEEEMELVDGMWVPKD